MKQLQQEVEENFTKFQRSCKDAAAATSEALALQSKKFLESYRRLVTLQAWRSELLESVMPEEPLGFFLEAQNDAVTSHAHASFGAWRSALQSLRSCIENTLFCMYYKDHPVELQSWLGGRHRLTFSDMDQYYRSHPSLAKIPLPTTGLDLLGEQYATLSRAVHASAKGFRMSVEGVGLQLWSSDVARLGKWRTCETGTIVGLNRLLMALFREHLQHSRLPNLRKAISLAIIPKHHAGIKRYLGISLFS